MAERYRGEVAFGFDPADVFWTDARAFQKFAASCINQGNDDDPYVVDEDSGFAFADHRDTAGCYGRADSVMDFVTENLDLSTCPNTGIIDAYVVEDEERLVVVLTSTEEDMAEFKHWEFSPYDTMDLERVDDVGNDEYEAIYKIGGFNRSSLSEHIGESKVSGKHPLREDVELFGSVLDAYNAGQKAIVDMYRSFGGVAPDDLDTIDCFLDDSAELDDIVEYWTRSDIEAAIYNVRRVCDFEQKQLINKVERAVDYILIEAGL